MISKRHLHLHRYIESIYFAYCFGSSLNSGSAIQFVRWLLGHCSASRFTPGASDSVVVSSWRRCSWKMVETALAGTNGRIKPFACACVWALFGYGLSSWHHVKSDCCDLLCIYTLSKMFSDQFLHVLSTTAHCSTPSASKFFFVICPTSPTVEDISLPTLDSFDFGFYCLLVSIRAMVSADLTLYTVLGVSRHATDAQIRAAYRLRALATHPDKGGNEEEFLKANWFSWSSW